MKINTKNPKNILKATLLVVGCLAVWPQVQAVTPPPDGCYSNFTTAEGCNALQNLATGSGNTGVGYFALFGTFIGNFNTGLGAGALILNNSDSNTAVGAGALALNTAGAGNSALGTAALVNNADGANNTAVGLFALQNNTSGSNITAIGANAGTDPGIGSNNVYIGDAGFGGDENVISIGGIAASGIDYQLTFIGGIYGGSVNTGTALPVYVDTDGHLGTTLVNGSAKQLRLRTPKGALPQAKANEFRKQEKRIADLESTVARLEAIVKEQAGQIERVSAQLQLQKPAQRTVADKH